MTIGCNEALGTNLAAERSTPEDRRGGSTMKNTYGIAVAIALALGAA
jgi:hypothetical protein